LVRRLGCVPAILLVVLLALPPTLAAANAPREASAVAPSLTTAEADARDLQVLIRAGLGANADGRLDAADAIWTQLRERHPTHPAGWVFQLDTLGWRKALNFTETRYDDAISDYAKHGLKLSNAWLKADRHSRDAMFYAGQSLIMLMKLNGMRGNLYRAGTQGEEARKHLERALEIDPEFHDAKYALGSYYYYASIATRYIRWLTWLWFVPTGERDAGLAFVEESAWKGDLVRFEAAATLARIGLYMEEDPAQAVPHLVAMQAAHPDSTYVQFELIELQMLTGEYQTALDGALALEANTRKEFGDAERRTAARIWRARAQLELGQVDNASQTLAPLEVQLDSLSAWGQRWTLLTRAQLQDLHGERTQAIANYEQVIERRARWGSTRSTAAAEKGIEAPFRMQEVSAGPAD
jgi:tetratricopeptide (TPR) repeat protein